MPNLAANHPQVVHFAIALLLLSVAFPANTRVKAALGSRP